MQSLIDKAKDIRLVIFDVDGVLTAGVLSYDHQGIESKHFHVHDGQGMKFLKKSGVEIAIITTCQSEIIKRRMQDLGVTHTYQGHFDKLPAYEDVKQKLNLQDNQIAYVGDDLPDLPMLLRVGLAVTVANAPKIIQDNVHWITKAKGGKGAAREVCDFIMQAQGTYQTMINSYLQR
ncbi:MAG TPA: HAD-IIIA family hydrolase [Gammaproteobacteria bacterium]|jgi:3-deoxy-D-manno-octulosonate 8-phosphate phosphatase (KDO 8-P phosphatase)|nr:HAD-IIIA family hydrolase [Gammaproteobacteria bacterium]